MTHPSSGHEQLALAIAPLSEMSSFKDDRTKLQMLKVAQALAKVRSTVEASVHSTALARLRAMGVTADRLVKISNRLPHGPLQGLLLDQDRTAAVWANSMLEYGWHGLARTSQIAWGLGIDHHHVACAADNPTVSWLARGDLPVYLRGTWQVLGGVIDAPLLRALCELSKCLPHQPDTRSFVFTGSYSDTLHQVETTATALVALDLRMQECRWLLGQITDRIDTLAQRVLSALETRYNGAGRGTPVEYIFAEFDESQQKAMSSGCSALLRIAQVRLVDDVGALTDQGKQAVAEARRHLLSGPQGALVQSPVATA